MKKTLRNFFALTAILFLVGTTQSSFASHFLGGDMTYVCVAPNIYSVNLKLYRDCSGSNAPTSATLNIKSTGCNTGRNLTMTKVGTNRLGNPYCASIPAQCTLTGRTNYEEVVFTANVVFSTTEQACQNWVLSWSECCRPSSANLAGQDNPWQEAMINLTPGVNNNSPQFDQMNIAIPFVNFNQPIQISLHAIETDGDSLVYSLADPQNGYNTVVPKTTLPATMTFNSDSTKYTMLPAVVFSSGYPIVSYFVDWSLPMPITPVKRLMFANKTGSMGFIPNLYDAASAPSAGKNKYVLVVQIDEYRKINGAYTKVGMVRRDMMINVVNAGLNQNPNIHSPVVNGQAIAETDIIKLRPGTPMNMQFATNDGNSNDVLTLVSDVANVLPGATFTASTGNKPTVTVNWTPTASHIKDHTYYFHVTVQDNACPVKGYQTHTFGVRVSATGGVTGVNELTTLPRFVAYPNPFSEIVSFKVNITGNAAQKVVIYNILGQEVDKIDLKGFATGEQTVTWKKASKMAKGQYVAKLVSDQKEIQTIQFSKLQ